MTSISSTKANLATIALPAAERLVLGSHAVTWWQVDHIR